MGEAMTDDHSAAREQTPLQLAHEYAICFAEWRRRHGWRPFSTRQRFDEMTDEEIELGQGDLDTVFHDGSAIDLGGAVIDTLALALDPYPRKADAAMDEEYKSCCRIVISLPWVGVSLSTMATRRPSL